MARAFTIELDTNLTADELRAETLAHLARPLARVGYKLESQDNFGVRFGWEHRTFLVKLFVVLLFPLGLILLLLKRHETINVTFHPRSEGTRVIITGEAPRAIRKALGQLQFD